MIRSPSSIRGRIMGKPRASGDDPYDLLMQIEKAA